MHKRLRTAIPIMVGMLIICIFGGCGDDDPLEEVTDPPEPEDDIGPASATTVEVDPRARYPYGVLPKTEFTLTFNKEVMSVVVNGTPATGSGLSWKWTAQPTLPDGFIALRIEWKNRRGSKGCKTVGPYEVWRGHDEPPAMASGTVEDGAADVDPVPINAGGFRFDFNERITGTVKLTDEAGVDLNWIASIAYHTATLTPVAGQELVNKATYKIEIDVQDGAGHPLQTTITFVTKPE